MTNSTAPRTWSGGSEQDTSVHPKQYCNVVSEFRSHELICDPERYRSLPAVAAGDFFPQYRSPRPAASDTQSASG
jgi:hypothetical protein